MIVRARTLLARARLLFYALRADHLRESPAEQRRESTRSEPRGLSAQIALYSRAAVARARASLWFAYGRRKFDESKHPRAPKGTPEGGRFIHGGTQPREFFVPESLQPWADFVRSQYDEVPSRTTAELNLELNARLRELENATTDEERAHARLWCDRIQEALADRNFRDDDAPLIVKERVWAAQQKFAQLFAQRRILESWLSQSKRTILKSSDSVRIAQEKLAAVKRAMEELAAVSGSKLPHDNPIRTWSFEQKFAAAVDVALRSENLAPDIEAELRAAIEPANLARTGAAMAALAAAHAYPVAGVAADSILLGYAGVDGALLAHRLYLEIDSIQSETDLQSTAAILEKELASQAADKLIGLLTWGGGKGVASFHKNYKVTLDRAKVRRLSTGEMPLSPNPKNLIPIKVEKRARGGSAAQQTSSTEFTTKPEVAKAVAKNESKRQQMVKNQQKELQDAIDRAPVGEKAAAAGRTLNKQGKEVQDLSDETLAHISGVTIKKNAPIGSGLGSRIDHIVSKNDTKVYIETKYSIRTLYARTINQLTKAVGKAQPGDSVFLNVTREPTPKERLQLDRRLGEHVARMVHIVSSQTELFDEVRKALQ